MTLIYSSTACFVPRPGLPTNHEKPYYSNISVIVYLLFQRRRRPPLPFPPGPKGLPLIGNLRDLPTQYQWLNFEKLGQEIGSDIVHLELLGTHLVVLNSEKVANDLLEKRSSIYSDRLDAGSWALSFFPYGTKWRTWHKAFYAHLQPSVVHRYHPIETKASQQLLCNLLDTPQDFLKHLRQVIGQTSLSIAYGIDVAPRDDPNIALADEALQGMYAAQNKGRIFNYVPFCKPNLLSSFTFRGGSLALGFKKDAETHKRKLNQCRDEPYEAVKRGVGSDDPFEGVSIRFDRYFLDLALTTAAVQSFVLAMVLYPEVQKHAQEEIDSVLGHGHLPGFGDEDALPYLKAVLYELLRWGPPGPLGIPHRLTEDDVYNGYFFPAGSLVISNLWAILHDPATYPEPSKFKPERFLDRAQFPEAAFGFGRRKCPGRALAWDAVWLAMASMLAVFEFLPATDADGRPAPPAQEFTSRAISEGVVGESLGSSKSKYGEQVSAIGDSSFPVLHYPAAFESLAFPWQNCSFTVLFSSNIVQFRECCEWS
ncbi:cytochrome P450 [Lactarius pseudohatsudake]|nr:cytochrome P450 [Lactarius pseudohatsudake]